MHSKWSFRGHVASAKSSAPKFFAVSLVSYGANTFWVWLLTDDAMFAGPWWWPLVPIVFLVLPSVLVIALFPGLQSLRLVVP